MSRRLKLFSPLEGAQRSASDPAVHAALSASAGTGKTHVLTARVLRLLLRGVAPETILCLTFTKAGAAEMANRIGARLAAWVRLADGELSEELSALGEAHDPPSVAKARRLFARVLEAPGGLRIQTIHSFAQALLASFPAEAGLPSGFEPIEGRAESELRRRTLAGLLADAEAKGNGQLLSDVETLSLRLGEGGAEEYLHACAKANDAIVELGDPSTFADKLRVAMNVPEGDVEKALLSRLDDGQWSRQMFDRIIAANRAWAGSKKGAEIVAQLDEFVHAGPPERLRMLDSIHRHIIKNDGEPCVVSAKQEAADPDYADLAAEFGTWLNGLKSMRIAAGLAETQAAALRAGAHFGEAYARAKRAAGVADFDDLIRWTRALFEQPGIGDWVRFKLDQRTDHILVDEAQDTNADQWAIVGALAEEFFTGADIVDQRWRTLFMVGDYKQAIFGFQGTDPQEFEKFRGHVAQQTYLLGKAGLETGIVARDFLDLSIDASFRSSPAVLHTVDAVIAEVGHEAMGLPHRPNPHQAARGERPGRVELWPPFMPVVEVREGEGEEGWVAEPVRLYADALARQIDEWVREAPVMATTGRALTPGDILILVRSRTELASLIVARLYARGVPVAGIDRLHLAKPMAVRDLISTIAFAVQPHDDLNLAGLLVSPLIGWSQQELFELAHGRGGSLWDAIQARRSESAQLAEVHAVLGEMLAMADYVPPARFLEIILSGSLGGRRKLLTRLGEAARDPIEELVASAMDFERLEVPSLDRFLAWFATGNVEVKRDPAGAGNAVRVMTVHGSKGLEAPLVVLADATHDPAKTGGNRSIIAMKLGTQHPVPLIRPRADERVSPFRTIMDTQKERDLQEHWRLLYVGLTRAAERLVIAGVHPSRGKVVDNSWHARTQRALEAMGSTVEAVGSWGDSLIYEGRGKAVTRSVRRKLHVPAISRPAFLDRPAPQEERPPRPLAPSQLVEDRDAMAPPTPEQRAAARRGVLLHMLFERLPGVDATEREPLALRWLERAGVESETARREITSAACSIIGDPAHHMLFGPQSLGEAPIAATLPDGRVVAGTVDRLWIAEDRVQVVDFKTGRSVPADLAAIPMAHRRQMEAYVAALSVIFPGKTVEAALLYTAGPRMIALEG